MNNHAERLSKLCWLLGSALILSSCLYDMLHLCRIVSCDLFGCVSAHQAGSLAAESPVMVLRLGYDVGSVDDPASGSCLPLVEALGAAAQA